MITAPARHAPLLLRRCISTSRIRSRPFNTGPSPPRLPEKEQKEFEELQRSSTGAFSTPQARKVSESSPQIYKEASTTEDHLNTRIEAKDAQSLHPDVRKGAPPEFEGDRNPKTGEIGGPKNDPLRWGQGGDWSYNGRVTDF